jgi:predicted aspartyl protease
VSFPFRRDERLILVDAKVRGPKGELVLRFALDTGASETLITTENMLNLGYGPAMASDWIEVTTATKNERAPVIAVDLIESIGIGKTGFGVLSHPLPTGAMIDGLLSLDFLRGSILTIDFRAGTLTLQA